jgi:peptide/nickel transport system ATP-binding protein
VLADALADVVADEPATARDRLAEAFPTVCARDRPTLGPTDAGHEAACHLHDARYAEYAPDETDETDADASPERPGRGADSSVPGADE